MPAERKETKDLSFLRQYLIAVTAIIIKPFSTSKEQDVLSEPRALEHEFNIHFPPETQCL